MFFVAFAAVLLGGYDGTYSFLDGFMNKKFYKTTYYDALATLAALLSAGALFYAFYNYQKNEKNSVRSRTERCFGDSMGTFSYISKYYTTDYFKNIYREGMVDCFKTFKELQSNNEPSKSFCLSPHSNEYFLKFEKERKETLKALSKLIVYQNLINDLDGLVSHFLIDNYSKIILYLFNSYHDFFGQNIKLFEYESFAKSPPDKEEFENLMDLTYNKFIEENKLIISLSKSEIKTKLENFKLNTSVIDKFLENPRSKISDNVDDEKSQDHVYNKKSPDNVDNEKSQDHVNNEKSQDHIDNDNANKSSIGPLPGIELHYIALSTIMYYIETYNITVFFRKLKRVDKNLKKDRRFHFARFRMRNFLKNNMENNFTKLILSMILIDNLVIPKPKNYLE